MKSIRRLFLMTPLEEIILALLQEQERSGKNIREAMEDLINETIGPKTLYDLLKELSEKNWIKTTRWIKKEKFYEITELGKYNYEKKKELIKKLEKYKKKI